MTETQYKSGRTQIKLKTLNRISDIVSSSVAFSYNIDEDDRLLDVKMELKKMRNELFNLKVKYNKTKKVRKASARLTDEFAETYKKLQ